MSPNTLEPRIKLPLPPMAAWILSCIVKYRALRSSLFKMYQICCSLFQLSVIYIWYPSTLYFTMLETVSMTIRRPMKYINTLVPDERASACIAMAWCFILLKVTFFAWGPGAFTMEFYMVYHFS